MILYRMEVTQTYKRHILHAKEVTEKFNLYFISENNAAASNKVFMELIKFERDAKQIDLLDLKSKLYAVRDMDDVNLVNQEELTGGGKLVEEFSYFLEKKKE